MLRRMHRRERERERERWERERENNRFVKLIGEKRGMKEWEQSNGKGEGSEAELTDVI